MPERDPSLQHGPTLVRTPSELKLIEIFREYYENNKGGVIDHPLRYIQDHELPKFLAPLHEKLEGLVTLEELVESAKLAKQEHLLDIGQQVDGLTEGEKMALNVQRSKAFWRESKDLLLTLAVCCLASMIQGWDQVANGNLGWTDEFGIELDPRDYSKRADTWKFAIVQAVPWFSASFLGSYLSDPLSEFTGRRTALFIATLCSLTSSVAGSQINSWESLVGTRVLLGLGIGGKASIVPVLESEVLPPSKRGRLLVSWQVFDAAGIFLGSIACYILRSSWRNQILSGAIPAFALLIATFASCESPRWLIIQERYPKAFTTLLRLRGERRLALKELASIHYQTQAERRLFIRPEPDDESGTVISPFPSELRRTSWWKRFRRMFYIPRIRRAAIAAMIVMIAQQLSGINILAFLATQFYSTAGPSKSKGYASATCLDNITSHTNFTASKICGFNNVTDYDNVQCYDSVTNTNFDVKTACEEQRKIKTQSFGFAIGFGAANMIFSCLAYFLVENKESEDAENKLTCTIERIFNSVYFFFTGNKNSKGIESETTNLEDNDQVTSTRLSNDRNHSSISSRSVERTDEAVQAGQSPNLQSSNRHMAPTSPAQSRGEDDIFPEYKEAPKLRGRRFLLLMSFAAGVVTLFLTSMMFRISNEHLRLRMISFFIIVFTAFYSPGAGAIPFLYCAEIFPNEGRELGMSWSTFWNFLGAGGVALGVPFGINWEHKKLLGLFSGFNAIAFILVWFFVYTTNHTTTLEDYSYVFGKRMTDHMRAQGMRLWHWSNDLAPSFHWKIGTERDEDMESSGRQNGRVISGQHSQQEAYTLPHIRRISTSSSRRDDDVELDILPNSTPQR